MTSRPEKLGSTVIVVIAFSLLLAPLMAQSPSAVNSKPETAGQAVSFDLGTSALWQSLQKLHTRASVLRSPPRRRRWNVDLRIPGKGARVSPLT
jgi:hypothetical protein